MSVSFHQASKLLGQEVEVTFDRPLGSKHPKHGFIYEANYGYIAGIKAPDGEDLDVYYLGVNEPLEKVRGVCIAVAHRRNNDDDKLIVVSTGVEMTDEEIMKAVHFQEQWFDTVIFRNTVVDQIGELAHKMLVEHRKKLDPKPYIKITVDVKWIKSNDTDQVNLSECEYVDLPNDWKQERINGSQIAFEKVSEKINLKGSCDESDIEEIANILHEKWLERNNMRASEEQKNRYQDISEYEKEKDRIFVKAALEIINNQN